MPVQCPTCSKVNPANAAYCYYDGRALGQVVTRAPLGPGRVPLPQPFPFSDGHQAENFNQLVLISARRWNEGRDNLRTGRWEAYFHSIARPDLAALARQSAREADPDMGLCRLLEGLPADPEALRPPKLTLPAPAEDLGALEPGKDYAFKCVIENQGMLPLQGCATTDCDWLVFTDGHGVASSKLFQTRDTHTLSVRVLGQKLRAGARPLEGQIVIDTNGGCQTIPVRATVPIRPFPRLRGPGTVLAGARSPRELAVKAKAHSKEAAVLFEQGAVKTWYESNGWTYPVQGSQARGKGAVQQFFEALGLTQPPRLEINTQRIACGGKPGQRLVKKVVVRTTEAKFVNVEGFSSQRWVKILPAKSEGNSVTIPLRIDVPERPGEKLLATVTFRGNGRQEFVVPVTLTVAGLTPEQEEKKEERGRRREWAVAAIGLFVLLVIGGPIGYRLYQGITSRGGSPTTPEPEQVKGPDGGPGLDTPVTRAAWWDKFPDSKLAASSEALMDKAGGNGLFAMALAVPGDDPREEAYKQLAAKLPDLARNKDARGPLHQFVVGCCVFEPQKYSIKPLLRGLSARLPQEGHPFPAGDKDKGSEAELAEFWLGVACDVITYPGVIAERRRALVVELNKGLGYVLDEDDPAEEIKEKLGKAVAQQCYHSMALTVDESPDRALAIRAELIARFPTQLTAAVRACDDVMLLEAVFAAGGPKDEDLWKKLDPIFRDCAESTDGNAALRVVKLYEKAGAGAGNRIELDLSANAKWGKVLRNEALGQTAKAKALRNRIAAQSEEAKKARAERVGKFLEMLAKSPPAAGQAGAAALQEPLRLAHASTLASILVEEDAEPAQFDELIRQPPGAQPEKPPKEEPPASKSEAEGEEDLIDPSTGNKSIEGELNESCKTDSQRSTYRRLYPIKLKVGEIYEISVESKDFTPYMRLYHGGFKLQEDSGRGAHFTVRGVPITGDGWRLLVCATANTDDDTKARGHYTLKVNRQQQQMFRFYGLGMNGMNGMNTEESGGNELKATPVNEDDVVKGLTSIDGDVRAAAFKNLAGSLPSNLPPKYAVRIAKYLLLTEWRLEETVAVKRQMPKVARCRPLLHELDDIVANDDNATRERTEIVIEGLFGQPQHLPKEDWKPAARKALVRRMLELAEKKPAAAGGDTDKAAAVLCNLYKEQGLAFGMESAALEGPTQLTEVLESLIKHVAARADKEYAKKIDRQVRATGFVAAENDLEHAVLLQRVWLDVLVHDLEGEAPEEAKTKMRQLLNDLEKTDRKAAGTLLDQLRLGEETALGVWKIVLAPKPK